MWGANLEANSEARDKMKASFRQMNQDQLFWVGRGEKGQDQDLLQKYDQSADILTLWLDMH